MTEKVQQALELARNFSEQEIAEFLSGIQEIFGKASQKTNSQKFIKADINVAPDDVWSALTANLFDPEDENDKLYYHYKEAIERFETIRGVDKVEFSFRNIILEKKDCHGNGKEFIGPTMFGNIPGVGFMAGGDWQWPIFLLAYLGVDGKLYAHIPKEGNCYNYEMNAAFGNFEDEDEEFLAKWLSENKPDFQFEYLNPSEEHGDLMFDGEKIIKEISEKLS